MRCGLRLRRVEGNPQFRSSQRAPPSREPERRVKREARGADLESRPRFAAPVLRSDGDLTAGAHKRDAVVAGGRWERRQPDVVVD